LGILIFGFITIGIPLLLMVLPAVLLIFARGVRPFPKVVWVLFSLLPTLSAFLLARHRFAPAVFALSPWGVYLLFLWFGRSPRAVGHLGRRRIWLALPTALYACLIVWSGIKIQADLIATESTHDVLWPMDVTGETYVTLRLPPHYPSDGLPAAMKPSTVRAPDRSGQIDVNLLWPSLSTRDYRNDVEFENFAQKVLNVEFHVLNRILSDGRYINGLTCAFEITSRELGKDCFNPLPVVPIGEPLASLAPRYGLSRRGSIEPNRKGVISDDIWFELADDGAVSTMIECPREGEGAISAGCKHSFEVQALNASVIVRYNRAYLPHWMEIQQALTKVLLSMRT
jgi:hypothetical protein